MIRFSTSLSRGLFRLFALILFALIGGVAVQSYAAKSDLITVASERQKQDPTLILTRGMAELVDMPGNIADVMVANPSTVDVMAIRSGRLYIVGTNLGSTNLIALDESGDVIGRLNVHVKIDEEPVRKLVHRLYPDEDVEITALEQQVILSGTVSTPDIAHSISDMVAHYIGEITNIAGTTDFIISNQLKVRGKQQVMLRVRVIELSRSILRELSTGASIEDRGFSFQTFGSAATAVPFGLFGAGGSIGNFADVTAALTALEEDGLARILAEPNLTAITGEQAGFLAGGEFPVPTGRDNDGNIIIEYRQFGVSLNFRPIVMSENRISLQLDTEVSSLSRESQVTLAGIQVPGLDVRRAATTVELGSGGTLMIAGLLQSQSVKNMTDIPGIKSIPILSDLLSSESFRRQETEMVVLVSPYLVQPFADQKQATFVPERPPKSYAALSHAFAANIRRTYSKLAVGELFSEEETDYYGYLLD